LTFWRLVLVAILGAGLYATVIRFVKGLGASTALSDQFPWGLWIGFDVMCGVALAAGGFTISAVVYIFNIERFKPIIRPTILTAFLGYSLVIVALFFDLGKPYNIWHPIIMWNPRSVMFEVGWCVTLYTTVLALEFSPVVFERLKLERPLKIVKSLTIPLVIMGVILSTLHQSSLGSLFLIVPSKLHPLWYSPLLPLFFFISAIALGCAMTILESFLSLRAFRKSLEPHLLAALGKVAAIVLGLYLSLKLYDLTSRGEISRAFDPAYEGRMFLAEILLGVIAPMVMLAIPKIRKDQLGLFVSALMIVMGFIMNRLNVGITGVDRSSGVSYFPSFTEVSVTLMIVAIGFVIFSLAVKYLRVFEHEEKRFIVPELPAAAALNRPLRSAGALVMALGACFVAGAMALAYSGVRLRTPAVSAAEAMEAAPGRMAASFAPPRELVMARSAASPGWVRFDHARHINPERVDCTVCHSGQFSMLGTKLDTEGRVSTENSRKMDNCGACHNGTTVFGIRDRRDCAACHLTE
jgi:c(7)-type cytochrome triheme protein